MEEVAATWKGPGGGGCNDLGEEAALGMKLSGEEDNQSTRRS